MENKQTITDVDFKEVPKEEVAPTAPTDDKPFDPAVYLTEALTRAGHPAPAEWLKDVDPRVQTATEENDRLFFANRAIRLYMSEQDVNDNISPRLLLAEGIGSVNWCAVVDEGIVPWLMGEFNKKGKRVKESEVRIHTPAPAPVEAEAPVAPVVDTGAKTEE